MDPTTQFDRSMKYPYLLLPGFLAALLAGCVIIDLDATGSPRAAPAQSPSVKPARLNLSLSLNCLPTCALIGLDLAQAGKSITAAYHDSGKFTVTPSDQVDYVADVALRIERVNDWLEGKACDRSFGLLPAFWRDSVRMTTTLTSPRGAAPWRFESSAAIGYRCHLLLAPLAPFQSEPDAMDRALTALSQQTIARAEAQGALRSTWRDSGHPGP